MDFAHRTLPGRRCWALEGTGSYGAGLTHFLLERGKWVVEIDQPARPARRGRVKTDPGDAVRAAREALCRDHLAAPRRRGDREALRVLLATRRGAVAARTSAINQLKALVIGAPDELRAALRGLRAKPLTRACAALDDQGVSSVEHRATRRALRTTAQRIQFLDGEVAELEQELAKLVRRLAPALIAVHGVGPISAAQVLVSWSHPGRLRSEAAFAALAGVAPIACSSGQVQRHRLSRAGTASSTGRCTPSCWPACATTRQPAPTPPVAPLRARAPATCHAGLKRAMARRRYRLLERHQPPDLGQPEQPSMTGGTIRPHRHRGRHDLGRAQRPRNSAAQPQ